MKYLIRWMSGAAASMLLGSSALAADGNIAGYGPWSLRQEAAPPATAEVAPPGAEVKAFESAFKYSDEIAAAGRNYAADVVVFTDAGTAQCISLTLNLFREGDRLEDAALAVKELRNAVRSKYDGCSVEVDSFNFGDGRSNAPYWAGFFRVVDAEGDILFMDWQGYELKIQYTTAEGMAKIRSYEDGQEAETVNKL